MSLYAIGDIHGCAQTLEALVEEIDPTENDHLVFIGDYIDRGPDSKGVINVLLQLRNRFLRTFLRGNHEAMMLNYLDHNELELWHINGGDSTLASYSNEGRVEIPEEHVEFIRDTVYYHDEPDFFFVTIVFSEFHFQQGRFKISNGRLIKWIEFIQVIINDID